MPRRNANVPELQEPVAAHFCQPVDGNSTPETPDAEKPLQSSPVHEKMHSHSHSHHKPKKSSHRR